MTNDKAKKKAAKKVEKAVRKAVKKGLTENALKDAVDLGLSKASAKKKTVGRGVLVEHARAAKRA